MNGTMIQYFHWYSPADGSLWKEVKDKSKWLSDIGITAVWLPPAYKAMAGPDGVGYAVYDLFDLGEFDQKGSVRTKYGAKQEYQEAIAALHEKGIQVIVDIVLNHKGGGDEIEKFKAIKVDSEDRNKPVSAPVEIESYTRFTFPGRKGKYSDFIWTFQCFTGVDYNKNEEGNAIYKIENSWSDGWEEMIDSEKGNYDFLMMNDIEFRNPAVREELYRWGMWYLQETGFDGVRLDAVKHISPKFYNEWLDRLRNDSKKEIFAVGEYWAPGFLALLLKYIEATDGRMHLFDSSLHRNFHNASNGGNEYDMRQIFTETLTAALPGKSVPLVDNHDTQPLQSLEAPIESWFKPIAYALILLRQEGYPCIFYPDLFGAHYVDKGRDGNDHEIFLDKVEGLETLIGLRRDNAYGSQKDYFDHANCIGWVREGDGDHNGCAVVLSNGDAGTKKMEMGKNYATGVFVDAMGKVDKQVTIDDDGWGDFFCAPGSVSVWVAKTDLNR